MPAFITMSASLKKLSDVEHRTPAWGYPLGECFHLLFISLLTNSIQDLASESSLQKTPSPLLEYSPPWTTTSGIRLPHLPHVRGALPVGSCTLGIEVPHATEIRLSCPNINKNAKLVYVQVMIRANELQHEALKLWMAVTRGNRRGHSRRGWGSVNHFRIRARDEIVPVQGNCPNSAFKQFKGYDSNK